MYSSIHNKDTSLNYDIYLDGDLYQRAVKSIHVDSVVLDLELQGLNIVDEIWNEDLLQVDLVSSGLLDDSNEEE